MNLHRLTAHHLHHIRLIVDMPRPDRSFASPSRPESMLRGRLSLVVVGQAALDGERACIRFNAARSGSQSAALAEQMALDALGVMAKGAEAAMAIGDPYRVGLLTLRAVEPWVRAVRAGRRMTLEQFRAASDRPPFRGRWYRAMRALSSALLAALDVEPADDDAVRIDAVLAEMMGRDEHGPAGIGVGP